MSLPVNYDGGDVPGVPGGVSIDLSFRGQPFAQATLSERGDYATLGCRNPRDPYSSPTRVSAQLGLLGRVACTLYTNADPASPNSARLVLECKLGGTSQRLALEDAAGRPWAQVEVGETLRLFDLEGRERACIAYEKKPGKRLTLRCFDEQGQELRGQTFLLV